MAELINICPSIRLAESCELIFKIIILHYLIMRLELSGWDKPTHLICFCEILSFRFVLSPVNLVSGYAIFTILLENLVPSNLADCRVN